MGGEGYVVSETIKLCGVAAAKPTTPHTIGISDDVATATIKVPNCATILFIMNDFYLLSLLERIANAYDNDCILSAGTYSSEFRSLIGDIKDILSEVE